MGVTKVHTTDETTNVINTYSTKTAIKQANIEYLPELFLFADNTKLCTSPLLEEFGCTGDTIAGYDVTEGTYVPPSNTDEHTNIFLQCMKRPDHVPETAVQDTCTR